MPQIIIQFNTKSSSSIRNIYPSSWNSLLSTSRNQPNALTNQHSSQHIKRLQRKALQSLFVTTSHAITCSCDFLRYILQSASDCIHIKEIYGKCGLLEKLNSEENKGWFSLKKLYPFSLFKFSALATAFSFEPISTIFA